MQVCGIDLVVQQVDRETVHLKPGSIIMVAKKELTQYFITDKPKSPTLILADEGGLGLIDMNASIFFLKEDPGQGIKLQLVFKRRLTNDAMTTFFPSVLLICISYATAYFKSHYFEATLTVNLTVMLVITTLFISVMDKLPPTSYIKWAEKWLIFAQLIPFLQAILATAIQYFEEEERATGQHLPNARIKKPKVDKGEIFNVCWDMENEPKKVKPKKVLLMITFTSKFRFRKTIFSLNQEIFKKISTRYLMIA